MLNMVITDGWWNTVYQAFWGTIATIVERVCERGVASLLPTTISLHS